MMAYADAPTTFSEPHLPVASDRYVDSVANMALSSNPGAYDLFPGQPRRKWLLPAAFGLAGVFAMVAVIAIFIAFRSSGPKTAARAAPPAPVVTVEDQGEIPPPEPVTTTAAETTKAAADTKPVENKPEPPAAPPPQSPPPVVARTPSPPSTNPSPQTPPRTTPSAKPSRKDVYRPF